MENRCAVNKAFSDDDYVQTWFGNKNITATKPKYFTISPNFYWDFYHIV